MTRDTRTGKRTVFRASEATKVLAAGRTARGLRVLLGTRTRMWAYYDAAVATLAAILGFRLTPFFPTALFTPSEVVLMYGLAFVFVSLAAGTYERRSFRSMTRAITRAFTAAVGAWVVVLLVNYFVRYQPVGRWIVMISTLIAALASALPRAFVSLVLGGTQHRVLVVGDTSAAEVVRHSIEGEQRHDMEFTGSFPACLSQSGGLSRSASSDLLDVCQELKVDTLVVAEDSGKEVVDQAVECRRRGVHVTGLVSFMEDTFKKVPIGSIGPAWLISADMNQARPLGALAKRGIDVVLATLGLIVTLPFWPLIALLVKLSSRGPVFYSQERVGQTGLEFPLYHNFRLYKFRTMRVGAEADGEAVWATRNDSRVTLIGRILRRTRIDEMPQFINVLKGDMAFVGPRPERPQFVDQLGEKIPHYGLRHLVRPGITGWAQVCYRYGASVEDAEEKLRYDLYYVKHSSVVLDLRIMLRTLGTVFKGAR